MDRKEFLFSIAVAAASIAVISCVGYSKSSNDGPLDLPPKNVDFTLDLTATANLVLAHNGGYIYSNGVIVARTTTASYISVSQTCRNEDSPVIYLCNGHQFYCQLHGAITQKKVFHRGARPNCL